MSDHQALCDMLRGMGFLEGIADEYVRQVADVGRQVDFEVGQVVFREGDAAVDVYLIVSGTVSLDISAPGVGSRRILTVGEGELLGWSPILHRAHLTATARTLTPTRAVKISAKQLLTLCEHSPRFGFEFMRRTAVALAGRLSATRMQMLDVFGAEHPPAGLAESD